VLDLAWQEEAACKGEDTSAFYPEGDEFLEEPVRLRRLCGACPVVKECQAHALSSERYGFWGNTTRIERDQIRAERKIPFKSIHPNQGRVF